MKTRLNADDVGRASEERIRVIEADAIRGFAEALGDTNPLWTDQAVARAAGYPDVVAPPTFAIVLDAPWPVDFELAESLHGEQSLHYSRPIVAGDVLRVRSEVAEVYGREARSGRLTFLVIETTGRDDRTGDVVFRARSTSIFRDRT
jgi:acyl dehydratase